MAGAVINWIMSHACGSRFASKQGWEDALEAVLRERINALALPRLEEAARWRDVPPAKLAVFMAAAPNPRATPQLAGLQPLAELCALPGYTGDDSSG